MGLALGTGLAVTTITLAPLLAVPAAATPWPVTPSAAPGGLTAQPTRARPETWQVAIQVPKRLWHDAANMAFLTPTRERVRVGRRTVAVLWSNFTISADTTRKALAEAALRTHPQEVALSDRPLTPGESRRLTARPLWLDADVLVTGRDNPLCLQGLSLDQARGLLRGDITSWSPFTTDPRYAGQPITVYVPATGDAEDPAEELFGIDGYGPSARPVTESSAVGGAGQRMLAVTAARYSALRKYPGGCAVPIDGVAPSDETVRSQAYPTSFTVYWVTKRSQETAWKRQRLRYEQHLFGARGAGLLSTMANRDRLRP